ncbi:hypothetical protein EYC80_003086 [Monilinia laxa]|uniref:Uncharacterized protein n=1 Tax=Monilinia laxa TaxID=61186 RepID=A0A5N6KCM5_MONLA|nr:hypothetical protein EYC80_003086 [Monilinia laxa]
MPTSYSICLPTYLLAIYLSTYLSPTAYQYLPTHLSSTDSYLPTPTYYLAQEPHQFLDLHPRSQNPKLSKDKHLPSFSLAPPTSYLISRNYQNHTVNFGKAGLLTILNPF